MGVMTEPVDSSAPSVPCTDLVESWGMSGCGNRPIVKSEF